MKLPALIFAAASLSLSVEAAAQTDCHRTMKDMLQGTLDLASESENRQQVADKSIGCSLAMQLDRPTGIEVG